MCERRFVHFFLSSCITDHLIHLITLISPTNVYTWKYLSLFLFLEKIEYCTIENVGAVEPTNQESFNHTFNFSCQTAHMKISVTISFLSFLGENRIMYYCWKWEGCQTNQDQPNCLPQTATNKLAWGSWYFAPLHVVLCHKTLEREWERGCHHWLLQLRLCEVNVMALWGREEVADV